MPDAIGALADELAQTPIAAIPQAADRLREFHIDDLSASPTDGSAEDRLWWLTETVTTLAAQPDAPTHYLAAAAALQDLTIRATTDEAKRAERLARLNELCQDLTPEIRVSHNGPYLAVRPNELVNYLAAPLDANPLTALCRCGESKNKPFCDGTHTSTNFTGDKDPNRVPDRRDTYVGQQVTVLDNRGICAHSGFCTNRLATVFHAGSEPFVTPSGGRMDEIMRATRSCPSGALSFAIDGLEARDEVDHHYSRPQSIEVSKDGPYRITGNIPLNDETGADMPRAEGASREHYSLCRCGHSQNKPFCSGMHYYVNFTDPQLDPDEVPSLFEWAGGYPALLRMTKIFYEKYVPSEPLLAPLFANMSPDHPERVAAWLSEVFGGPKFYSDQYGGYARMISQHLGKHLREEQRAAWVRLLSQSAQDAGLPADPEFRAAFVAYLEWGSRIALENSQTEAHPPEGMPVPRWWWVCDANPRSRVSALAKPTEEPEAPIILPGAEETVSYAQHIKPMFRSRDRNSMRFVFDLWNVEDVRTHAAPIRDRLRAGTMPCDGAWPSEHVDVFARWVDTGMTD